MELEKIVNGIKSDHFRLKKMDSLLKIQSIPDCFDNV